MESSYRLHESFAGLLSAHCYAESVADRFWKTQYPQIQMIAPADHDDEETHRPRAFTDVQCHEDRLDQPLRWRKPRRVFVNSMSDLFHEDVPDAFIDHVFAAMAMADQHTFQVLTKRPERMRRYLASMTFGDSIISEPSAYKRVCEAIEMPAWMPAGRRFLRTPTEWPLPNVWLGVSVENQHFADERIPILLETPAAVRFVSYEPALGPVSFRDWLKLFRSDHVVDPTGVAYQALDWVIVGGESGKEARPFEVEWARSVIRQCRDAGVACFVKQLGRVPIETSNHVERHTLNLRDSHGGDWDEWEADLRVREFPGEGGRTI